MQGKLQLGGSKSETNRLLLLQALYPDLVLENRSESDDSKVMEAAFLNETGSIDVHHAGTAMRFLTAYFAMQDGKTVTLSGSARMKQRPIKLLVDALRELGAKISYLENEGCPPLKITGTKLTKSQLSLAANVSSQYVSALLLIAPKLENGLELVLEGEISSRPYIEMTLRLLNQIGIGTAFAGNRITVNPTTDNRQPITVTIESDWSSASYFYSIVALSPTGTQITLSSFNSNSLQGDSILAQMYTVFGVETVFRPDHSIVLTKREGSTKPEVTFSLNDTPDLAQTIAVTCFGLGVGCHLTGLHTLKIKETDRLLALRDELTKLGATVSVTEESLLLQPSQNIRPNVKINTYQDHRMAMALAPLAVKVPVVINDAEVVSKSYPGFWKDLQQIGFQIEAV